MRKLPITGMGNSNQYKLLLEYTVIGLLQLAIQMVQNRRCWRAKVALGQDKQRKLPFKIMYVFCLSCPSATFALQRGGFVPREWLAAKSLLLTTTRMFFNLSDISLAIPIINIDYVTSCVLPFSEERNI